MASYCECGHVLADHLDVNDKPTLCYSDDECDCEGFEEIPSKVLDRGWD